MYNLLKIKWHLLKTISLVCLSLLMTSCASKTTFEGQIIDGRYYAPNGQFSVKKPYMTNSGYITENFATGTPAVIFSDDYGKLVRIEVSPLDSETLKLKNSMPIEAQNEMCAYLYHEVVKKSICSVSPNAKTIYESTVNEQDFHGYFAIIEAPNASNIVDANIGKPLDSIRGYFLSFVGNQLVVISCQNSPLIPRELLDSESVKHQLFNNLIEIHASYKNETIN